MVPYLIAGGAVFIVLAAFIYTQHSFIALQRETSKTHADLMEKIVVASKATSATDAAQATIHLETAKRAIETPDDGFTATTSTGEEKPPTGFRNSTGDEFDFLGDVKPEYLTGLPTDNLLKD